MKTVSDDLIPYCRKDVQHIASPRAAAVSNTHSLPQSSSTFYAEYPQDVMMD